MHPFWLIKRKDTKKVKEVPNLEVVYQDIRFAGLNDYATLNAWGGTVEASAYSYHVLMPFLSNPKEIKADDQLILDWKAADEKEKVIPKNKNAFDQWAENEAKRRRLNNCLGH